GFHLLRQAIDVGFDGAFGDVAETAEGEKVVDGIVGHAVEGAILHLNISDLGRLADVKPELVMLGRQRVQRVDVLGTKLDHGLSPRAGAGTDLQYSRFGRDVRPDPSKIKGVNDVDVTVQSVGGNGQRISGVSLVIASLPDALEGSKLVCDMI